MVWWTDGGLPAHFFICELLFLDRIAAAWRIQRFRTIDHKIFSGLRLLAVKCAIVFSIILTGGVAEAFLLIDLRLSPLTALWSLAYLWGADALVVQQFPVGWWILNQYQGDARVLSAMLTCGLSFVVLTLERAVWLVCLLQLGNHCFQRTNY